MCVLLVEFLGLLDSCSMTFKRLPYLSAVSDPSLQLLEQKYL